MLKQNNEVREVLIVSITPYFLERGVLWFRENFGKIKNAVKTSGFWQTNAVIIEKDLEIKPGELLRHIADFGYGKTNTIYTKGEFSHRGNIIDIWPINSETPFRVEFFGNEIENIFKLPKGELSVKTPKAGAFSKGIGRLKPGDYVVHIDHGIGIFRGITAENKIRNPNFEIRNPSSRTLRVRYGASKSEIQNLKYQTGLEIENCLPVEVPLVSGTKAGKLEITTKNFDSKFFVVEYASPRNRAEPDRLYVPLEQEKRLAPYIGFETPAIHRLGGDFWAKTKKKAREDAEKFAKELLKIYAARENVSRPAYEIGGSMEREFSDVFEFTETEDQQKVLEEIKNDLMKSRPMDRIIAGDVGFGKTELAMRAAFWAADNNYQAVMISPTTILANEHGKTFAKRFQNFPVTIRVLSRLTPAHEAKKIIEGIKNGGCDIVIGTHRLLSKDIVFKNLGLVIIDEEQRFGVKQKEKFKSLRSSCDILSLSATPIPRTLNLALAKLRSLSLLRTPPSGRLTIKTHILPHSYKIFGRAVMEEIKRGGQIYFLHNRIETISAVKERLQKAILHLQDPALSTGPGLVIEILHAKLPETTTIRLMDEFRKGKIDVLLATSIIENGLDFSNANTLIVDDASRLGLSQAYQIRGRIGRSHKQAYAYFAYQPRKMTVQAMERLLTLKEFEELGSGYEVALRDLEMRGAGNILGREQSGAVNKVGFNLYCQILAEAVEELKSKNPA